MSNLDDYEDAFAEGRWLLAHPVLPLVRLVQWLYLSGPFATVAAVLDELVEPIETAAAVYDEPAKLLRPYLPVLSALATLKTPAPALPVRCLIMTENREPLDLLAALDLWIGQQVLTMELARLNSLLCRPCGCALCCTGPDRTAGQEDCFFEIPLAAEELNSFALPQVDTVLSRRQTARAEPPLLRADRPFYQTAPALYNWRTGWSLILPVAAACPHLDLARRLCRIYPHRPAVCRRPQIFPYVLERRPDLDKTIAGEEISAYISRRKVLAVWDCPYVQKLQAEIAAYAELADLEPVFKHNKK